MELTAANQNQALTTHYVGIENGTPKLYTLRERAILKVKHKFGHAQEISFNTGIVGAALANLAKGSMKTTLDPNIFAAQNVSSAIQFTKIEGDVVISKSGVIMTVKEADNALLHMQKAQKQAEEKAVSADEVVTDVRARTKKRRSIAKSVRLAKLNQEERETKSAPLTQVSEVTETAEELRTAARNAYRASRQVNAYTELTDAQFKDAVAKATAARMQKAPDVDLSPAALTKKVVEQP